MIKRLQFDPEKHARRLAPWGAVLTLLGAAIGGWFALPFVLIGMTCLLFACVSRQDGFLLLGPIATSELVRAARLGQRQLWRAIYAVVAGLIVFLTLASYLPFEQLFDTSQVNPRLMANINLTISVWFSIVLFGYVSVLTMQVMSGAIAEEREKKRWDVLLTTDLRGREILLGKLFGRMPILLDPILAALPILAVLPMFGGVPPWLAWTTILACVSVMFSLGGISLFYSVFAKSRNAAMGYTFRAVFLYCVCTYLTHALLASVWLEFITFGNPFVILQKLFTMGLDIEAETPQMAWHFAIFHFAMFFLFALVAIRRLPRAVVWGKAAETLTGTERVKVAAVQAGDRDRKPTDPPRKLKPEREPLNRPRVEDLSITWWERYGGMNQAQLAFDKSAFGKRLGYLFFASVAAFGLLWALDYFQPFSDFVFLYKQQQILFLLVYVVAILLLIPVPFRAARCVVREREADTLESLLLVPLSRREILFQKWLGVCLCDWPGFACLMAWYLPAVLFGHVPVLVGIVFVVGWAFTVCFLSALGITCSVISKTTSQATLRVFLGLNLLIFGMLLLNCAMETPTNNEFLGVFLFPPAAYNWVQSVLHRSEVSQLYVVLMLASWLAGMLFYGLIGVVLFKQACNRLEAERNK